MRILALLVAFLIVSAFTTSAKADRIREILRAHPGAKIVRVVKTPRVWYVVIAEAAPACWVFCSPPQVAPQIVRVPPPQAVRGRPPVEEKPKWDMGTIVGLN
jgi:hypothetical protein